jgi:hypothetical protein
MLVRRLYYKLRWWALTAALAAFFCWSLPAYTGWPLVASLKHLVAFAHCKSAAIVGLAHAKRGHPGYWEHHDLNGDGVACE